ncbi:MAG: hypothetical protein JNJ48_02855 [Phycisphaerae bacterium]|nr:hypothetical protein [Phycisphaerae bacterium]
MNATDLAARVQALLDAGRPDDALAEATRWTARRPGDAAGHLAVAHVWLARGQRDRALLAAERAHRLAPEIPGVLALLGGLLVAAGRAAEAEPLLRRACDIDPLQTEARAGLCAALMALRRLRDAAEIAESGLELCPADAGLLQRRGEAALLMGHADLAVELLGAAALRAPESLEIARSLAFAGNYDSTEAGRIAAVHGAHGRLMTEATVAPAGWTPARAGPGQAPPEPLTIGLLSPDLRDHPVGRFALPLLRHLDRSRFRIVGLAAHRSDDGVARELRGLADDWCDALPAASAELARLIRQRNIDVLIDLAGLTSGHRLDVFPLRPAPLQGTYRGYPATTGLASADFRLGESATDPPGAPATGPERLVRLDPCLVCWRVPREAPEVRARRPGPIVFGSFNNLAKIGGRVIGLWARVLNAVPGSVLAVKALGLRDGPTAEMLVARLHGAGIAQERLRLLAPTERYADHLAQYESMDIALDTFPYHGTTTTCEALSMGVPVVSRAGDLHAGRVGVSLLRAVGLSDLACNDDEAFVSAAAALAGDASRLARLRAELRGRVEHGPLGDERAFAARFGEAVLSAWRAAAGVRAEGDGP